MGAVEEEGEGTGLSEEKSEPTISSTVPGVSDGSWSTWTLGTTDFSVSTAGMSEEPAYSITLVV